MWYDIDMSFDMKPSGDLQNQIEIKAIENSLGNIFKTRISTRRQLYPFAGPTWFILFEQMDEITAERLGHELLDAIAKWEDRIVAENINVWADEDNNLYIVTLSYRIVNEGSKKYTYEDILRAI